MAYMPYYNQKTAKLTPEEEELRKENLEARKHMQDEGVRNLCAAICLNSCHEYRRIMRKIRAFDTRDIYTAPIEMKHKGRPRRIMSAKDEEALNHLLREKKELEEFFGGEMFAFFTGVSSKEEAIRKVMAIPNGYDQVIERRMMV